MNLLAYKVRHILGGIEMLRYYKFGGERVDKRHCDFYVI